MELVDMGVPPEIVADFQNILRDGFYWAGPRLQTILYALYQLHHFPVPGCETLMAKKQEQSIDAAVADGEDFEQQFNYDFAVKCYHYAATLAQMFHIVDHDLVADLLYKQSAAMLKMGNLPDAYEKVCKCVEFKPDFLKGYTMKSVLLQKHHGIRAFPAFFLLSALEHCQLTTDEQVDLIVEASQLLASVAQDSENGKDLSIEAKGIEQLRTSKSTAKLPESKTVWNRVFQKLYSSQDLAAIALLSVGLPDGNISQLSACTCSMDVDCSKMVAEQVYESLSSSDVETWGDRLAIFIVDHGGAVSRQTDELLGVNCVRLALKQKSLVLLQHVLQTKGADTVRINQPSPQGDTALHVVVKSTPLSRLHQRIIDLLIRHGATSCIPDANGKAPDEYVDRTSVIFKLLHGQMTGLEEHMASLTVHPLTTAHSTRPDTVQKHTNTTVERLKSEGKRALQARDFSTALDCYKDAVAELEKMGSRNMARDLAVLYCNMATVYTSMMDAVSACSMAEKSIELDPTYHKPYWRLGKVLLTRGHHLEACEDFLRGASCREANMELKSTFLTEICGTLPSLSEKQAESILDRMQRHLESCWPKIAENLTKNSQWDAIRRLVLGPPCLPVDKSVLPAGWKYADRCTDDPQQKVGYAMCLKAMTHDLSTLVPVVEGQMVPDVCKCAGDLVLALLLQGAKLEMLATKEDGSSCYHVAVNLCCLTEKLGLMRYILSDNTTTKKAQQALDDEKRTLLHSVCLHFSDGEHMMGQNLVSLLMEKGFDPAARDILQKRAGDYLAPGSTLTKILACEVSGPPGKTAEELGQEGNSLFKKRQYREAITVYSKAIAIVSSARPSSVTAQTASRHDKEKHELAVLFGNRAECHMKLSQTDKALSDAMESVSWDGHWYKGHRRVGQILMEQRNPDRALRAFTNAFNALEDDSSEKLKVAVLKELMKCLVQTTEQSLTRPPNLGYVSGELWTMVAYELLCEGNRFSEMHVHIPHLSWKAGQYAVTFLIELITSMMITQHSESLPRLQLDLQPLCSWHVPEEFTEAFALLFIALLSQGSDHSNLSFYKGDTYVHATVCFTMLSGETLLLDHVMTNYVQPKNEENIQDADGNTVLHIVAMPVHQHIPHLHSECRESMTEILLEIGMDPSVRNKEGKTALECLSPSDNSKLKKILQAAIGNCGARPQISGASSKQKTLTSLSKSSQGLSKPTSADMRVERVQQCSDCQKQLNDVRLNLDLKPEALFEKLLSVLGCLHPKNSTNTSLMSQAVDLIVKELGKSGSADTPAYEVLLTLSTSHLQQVLEKLAAQDKWLQLEAVVKKALSREIPLSHFAKSISIKALVCSQGLLGLEPQRVQILDLLISHGAQLVGNQGRDAMKVALQNGEFLVAERLLKLGTDPRLLTFTPGDNPLQVALEVALKKDTGNFAMFQYLVSLYEHDTVSFPFLDPHRQYAFLQEQIEKSDNTEVAQRADALLLPYK